jgi:hypothetical protein
MLSIQTVPRLIKYAEKSARVAALDAALDAFAHKRRQLEQLEQLVGGLLGGAAAADQTAPADGAAPGATPGKAAAGVSLDNVPHLIKMLKYRLERQECQCKFRCHVYTKQISDSYLGWCWSRRNSHCKLPSVDIVVTGESNVVYRHLAKVKEMARTQV